MARFIENDAGSMLNLDTVSTNYIEEHERDNGKKVYEIVIYLRESEVNRRFGLTAFLLARYGSSAKAAEVMGRLKDALATGADLIRMVYYDG